MAETIRTERLVLRPLRASDAGPISLHCSDERIARMTAAIPHPFPPGAAAAFIEGTLSGRRGEDVWAIDATPTDGEELIGVIGFKPEPAEIGYWVGPPYSGAGYATEAVSALVAHLHAARGLARIDATVFSDNPASAAVLAKAGFVEIGIEDGYSVARDAAVTLRRFRIGPAAGGQRLEPGRIAG